MAKWLLGLCVCLASIGCSDRPLPFPGGAGGSGGGGANGGGGGANGSGSGSGGSGSGHGGSGGSGGGSLPMPRLLSPLSTSHVSSRRPRLRWDPNGNPGAPSVDLCADRSCTHLLGHATVDASGTAATPDADLPIGPVFWRVNTGAQTSWTWELFVGKANALHNTSWGAVLDLDGDGVPDVAAGFEGDAVLISFGGEAGLESGMDYRLSSPDDASTSFGYTVVAAGDLDGDGYGDLAVGDCQKKNSRVYIYFGGPATLPFTRSQTLDAPDMQGGFGCRIAAAGDLDGDGYADLAVARVGVDFSGGLFIYKGGPMGVPTTTARIDSPDYQPSRLGYSLAGVGDLDGDGYDDLVASEIDYSAQSGRVHIYFGGAGGISNQHQVTILSPDPSGIQFGASVAATGDLDGDGYPDFVVGAPAVSATQVSPMAHVYLGGPGAITKSAKAIDLKMAGAAGFGAEVEAAGDLDGDGHADLAVSASSQVVIFMGAPGTVSENGISVPTSAQGTNPRHLAGAGDLNGDGYDDLLIHDQMGIEVLFGAVGGLAPPRPTFGPVDGGIALLREGSPLRDRDRPPARNPRFACRGRSPSIRG